MKRTDLRSEKNWQPPSLRELFAAFEAKVDRRKLTQAAGILERAFGTSLDEVRVNDAIETRRRLVEQMKTEGASAGIVQAFEQFFMGVIRRAALDGLIPPPPEGPWTQAWQAVLDGSAQIKGARAPLRSLAAWATMRGHSPLDLSELTMKEWASTAGFSPSAMTAARSGLDLAQNDRDARVSSNVLIDRLRKKATEGTVRRQTQYR
jgi:hypothetical protein